MNIKNLKCIEKNLKFLPSDKKILEVLIFGAYKMGKKKLKKMIQKNSKQAHMAFQFYQSLDLKCKK